MHPHIAKTLVGVQHRLDREPRLTYLPDSVYGEDDWKRKPSTIKMTEPKKPAYAWVRWCLEKIQELFMGRVL